MSAPTATDLRDLSDRLEELAQIVDYTRSALAADPESDARAAVAVRGLSRQLLEVAAQAHTLAESAERAR